MNVTLIRAIGSEYIRRKYRAVFIIFSLAAILALVFVVWLINLSAWWWLLAVPVFLSIVAGIVIAVTMKFLIKVASPNLTKDQKKGVRGFVDKLERVADSLQTPPFMILFHIIRDIIRPRKQTFIQAVADDSTTLHKDFAELQRLFR